MMSFQIKLVVVSCWLSAPYSLNIYLRAIMILVSQTFQGNSLAWHLTSWGRCEIWQLIVFQVVFLSFAFSSQFKCWCQNMTYLIRVVVTLIEIVARLPWISSIVEGRTHKLIYFSLIFVITQSISLKLVTTSFPLKIETYFIIIILKYRKCFQS